MTITYNVQLRYVPSVFLGTDNDGYLKFGTLEELTTVGRYSTYQAALDNVHKVTSNVSTEYLSITATVEDTINMYEVWVTFPCTNGTRTYVLSGHESFTPLLMIDPDLQPLQWQTREQATAYANKLQLSDYSVMQVSTEF